MDKRFLKVMAVSSLGLGLFLHNDQKVGAFEYGVSRIEGSNRFETAVNISQESYETADKVIITNAREFADALAGVPLAYQYQAPILLAQGNSIHASVIEEIERLGASEAIILGGEAAVSQGVEASLNKLNLNTQRIAGENRFETAGKIAESLGNYVDSNTAVVVDGFEFADAMSIAPFAAQRGMPIFLTRTNSLMNGEKLSHYDETLIIGGENAVSLEVEEMLNNPTRIAGENRYETNALVLDEFTTFGYNLFVSTGLDFVDALTGSVLAANNSEGIGLVRRDISKGLMNHIENNYYHGFTLLGGETVVPPMVINTIESYLFGEKVGEETLEFDLEAGYSMSNKFFDIPFNNGIYALYLQEGRLILSASDGNGYAQRELSLDGEVIRMYTDYSYDEYVEVTITTIGSLPE